MWASFSPTTTLEIYKGRKGVASFECLAQYFLSKNVPSRIDLINAISTGLLFAGPKTGVFRWLKWIGGENNDNGEAQTEAPASEGVARLGDRDTCKQAGGISGSWIPKVVDKPSNLRGAWLQVQGSEMALMIRRPSSKAPIGMSSLPSHDPALRWRNYQPFRRSSRLDVPQTPHRHETRRMPDG